VKADPKTGESRVRYVCVVGPTAGGKTHAAAAIARRFSVPVVVADARKVYREMNVGVNKPPPADDVAYYGMDLVSVDERFSAGRYAKYVHSLENELSAYPFVVLAGGTGMYVKAAVEGLDDLPDVPPSVREAVRKRANERGWQSFLPEIESRDPILFARMDQRNPARVLRAAELLLTHDGPISPLLTGRRRHVPTLTIGLFPPRPLLHELIVRRTEKMFREGLWDEARELLARRRPDLPAFRTIGYAECFDYWDGKIADERDVLAAVVRHTQQYAKRQRTWWNKGDLLRFETFDENVVFPVIQRFMECASG
jgi:tRNA dimethylallyltransferase